MTVQTLKKWGNSPAVRLPMAVMEAARLSVNQTVEVRAENGRVIIEPAVPECTIEDLIAGITEDNLHVEVNFGVPQGGELL